MSRQFDDEALDALEVVIPNLNWRYSGGTAVNRTIAPLIAKRWRAAWCGPDQPEGIAALSLGDLLRLRFRPPTHGKVRIWHARRNVEMLAGLFLNLFGYGFALIFNSASQRKKTWLTHFLIAPNGCGDRDERDRGAISPAPGDGHPSRHRRRSLSARPPTASRPSRKQACPANMGSERSAACDGRKAAICSSRRCAGCLPQYPGFLRRRHRSHDRRQSALCRGAQAADRRRRPFRTHPLLRRIADRGGAALVSDGFRSMCSPRGSRGSGSPCSRRWRRATRWSRRAPAQRK